MKVANFVGVATFYSPLSVLRSLVLQDERCETVEIILLTEWVLITLNTIGGRLAHLLAISQHAQVHKRHVDGVAVTLISQEHWT